jgi:hypothetical protein
MTTRSHRRRWWFFCCVLLLAGCDISTLASGDVLDLSLEPGLLYAREPDEVRDPPQEGDCRERGGALVTVRGRGSDGRPAVGARTSVWLDPAQDASLMALENASQGDAGGLLVLDARGQLQVCLIPGVEAGTLGLRARSGAIEATREISIRARVVPAGGTLVLTLSPESISAGAPTTPSTCGAPSPASCRGTSVRSAAVGVQARVADANSNVPAGARVVLTASTGWLSRESDCAPEPTPNLARIELMGGAAGFYWCFSDEGGIGTLSASSGSVSASASLTVPAVPTGVELQVSPSTAKAGDRVRLVATVTGCDGRGVPGARIDFLLVSGALNFEEGAFATTDATGVASVAATAERGPAEVKAVLARASSLTCSRTIEVTQ